MKYYKEFKKDEPQTIGETDSTFDMGNYIDWIDKKVTFIYQQIQLKDIGVIADVSKRDTLFEAARDVADLSDHFEPKNDKAFNAMIKLVLEVDAIEDINDTE